MPLMGKQRRAALQQQQLVQHNRTGVKAKRRYDVRCHMPALWRPCVPGPLECPRCIIVLECTHTALAACCGFRSVSYAYFVFFVCARAVLCNVAAAAAAAAAAAGVETEAHRGTATRQAGRGAPHDRGAGGATGGGGGRAAAGGVPHCTGRACAVVIIARGSRRGPAGLVRGVHPASPDSCRGCCCCRGWWGRRIIVFSCYCCCYCCCCCCCCIVDHAALHGCVAAERRRWGRGMWQWGATAATADCGGGRSAGTRSRVCVCVVWHVDVPELCEGMCAWGIGVLHSVCRAVASENALIGAACSDADVGGTVRGPRG